MAAVAAASRCFPFILPKNMNWICPVLLIEVQATFIVVPRLVQISKTGSDKHVTLLEMIDVMEIFLVRKAFANVNVILQSKLLIILYYTVR